MSGGKVALDNSSKLIIDQLTSIVCSLSRSIHIVNMFLLILVTVVLLIIVLYKIWAYNNHWKYIMEIPGPKGYPIIGTWTGTLSPEELFQDDRERTKQFYPINKVWSLNTYFVSIMCPEDVELIMGNSAHNNKSVLYTFLEEWLGTGLLTSNGSKWHRRRKILTPAFHFSILQPFVDVFNKETDNLVEDLLKNCDKEYIDVVKPITEYTLFSIGETSLGVNLRDTNSSSYKQAIHESGKFLALRIANPLYYADFIYNRTNEYKQFKNYTHILHDYSKKVISDRKKQRDIKNTLSYSERKRLALLDLMLEAGLNDDEVREEVDTFMFEGHDTTSLALCYILVTMANEPEYQEEIYEEIMSIIGDSTTHPTYHNLGDMKFMERCIKECLRLYPSVPFISRVTGETFKTSSGYTIPKGSITNIYIYDVHRAPEAWDDPEKFDPDRFLPDNIAKRHPFAYVPFSAGGRNCIGQKFAMLELKAALCGVLRKFKLKAVDKREDLRFKADLVLRSVNELKVKFVPR